MTDPVQNAVAAQPFPVTTTDIETRVGLADAKHGDWRMNLFMQISGGTSSELFRRDFLQAIDDPTVSAVVMDINSPGGTVDWTQELDDTIYANRGKKPVVALAEGTMASAATKKRAQHE